MGDAPPDISIRRLTPADATAVAELTRRNREFTRPTDPDRTDAAFDAAAIATALQRGQDDDRRVQWGIHAGDELVGRVTISNISRGAWQNATLGYMVDEAWNGRGIASRAVGLVAAIAFGPVGLHRLEAGTLVDNIASQRVLEKNGFVRVGVSPFHLRIAGEWRDHVLFALTRELWQGFLQR